MPDQAIAFTPYAAPDLTGLRAGQLVRYSGVLYDVEKVEVREELGGRNKDTGAPLMIDTRVDVDLQRARWTDAPWIEPPAALDLPDLRDPRHRLVINGLAYRMYSLDMRAAYVSGFRGPFSGVADEPEHIGLQLTRSPIKDPEPDRG
jgi:hypothetical protein